MNTPLTLTQITVNMTEMPLGIDKTPYFSWKVSSTLDHNAQTAYRIQVFSQNEALWDSGKARIVPPSPMAESPSPLPLNTVSPSPCGIDTKTAPKALHKNSARAFSRLMSGRANGSPHPKIRARQFVCARNLR